jgi:hypothetical protein
MDDNLQQKRAGDYLFTSAATVRRRVLSEIRSLSPIYLESDALHPRYLPPRVEFRSELMSARSTNVDLRRSKRVRAVRHTIQCNPETVYRAWHDLGTRTLGGTIVLSAERLDAGLPACEGTVWRVFGVGLNKRRAEVSSFFAVLNHRFAVVARSRNAAVRSANWYWREVGIWDWNDLILWPSSSFVSVENAAFDRVADMLLLAGVRRTGELAAFGRRRTRLIKNFCRVIRSDDGTWVCLNPGEEPEAALSRYEHWHRSMREHSLEITEEDLEAITLSMSEDGLFTRQS